MNVRETLCYIENNQKELKRGGKMAKEASVNQALDEQGIQNVSVNLPDLAAATVIFKALADETRLKIAFALTMENDLCVGDVAAIIGASVATASHHLRYMKEQGLAKSRRQGKLMVYSLEDEHVHQLIKIAYEHSKEVIYYDNEK